MYFVAKVAICYEFCPSAKEGGVFMARMSVEGLPEVFLSTTDTRRDISRWAKARVWFAGSRLVVYRDDYVVALRALTRTQRAEPYLTMLARAQDFVHGLDFSNLDAVIARLEEANAFKDPDDARLRFLD